MIYKIPGGYYAHKTHRILDEWLNHRCPGSQLEFHDFLKRETNAKLVTGNFEDGWTVEFDDKNQYTWFLLKWG